jgi:PAS domain S-box-containing protein
MQRPVTFIRRLWPRKLRSQLILGMALVHLVLMSIFVLDLLNRQYTFLLRQSQDQALSLANDLAVTANNYVVGNDYDGLERLVQPYKDFPHLEYAMVLTPDNTVISHTDPRYLGKAASDSVSRNISKQPGTHILIRNNHILDVAAPVMRDEKLIGWARVAIDQDYIFGNLVAIVRNGVIYILVAILLGTAIAILIGKRLTGGLYQLITAAEKIRNGDRTQRAEHPTGFELDLLATAFNNMLDNLVESEEKFRSLVEQSQVGVYIVQDEKFVYVNPVFEKISGYSRQELLSTASFDLLIHEADAAPLRRNYQQRMTTGRGTDRYVLRSIRRDGAVIFIEVIVSTIVYNNRPAVIGSLIDITDRLQEENRINKAVIDAQESERLQIGMELHDNVQQLMAGSLLTLDFVRSSYDDKSEALKALDNARRYIDEGIVELRRLSHQLAPVTRFSGNLADKIDGLVKSMNVSNTLDVHIEVDDFDLHPDIQLAFYRILQEQFTNILKYAGASKVTIRVKTTGDRISLSIRDNGRGFDPTQKLPGIGLENIRRRVTALEGDWKISSANGAGCELSLQVKAEPTSLP